MMAAVLTDLNLADERRAATVRAARAALFADGVPSVNGATGATTVRLTWSAPADLVAHALVQAADEGVAVDDVAARWRAAGGSTEPPRDGAGPAVPADVARLAATLLDEIDERSASASASARGRCRTWRRCPRRRPPTGCAGHGWGVPSVACWASRSRSCPATASARSPRRRATGRSPATSPRVGCPTMSRRRGRGTGAAGSPAWSRRSTGSPRTTT